MFEKNQRSASLKVAIGALIFSFICWFSFVLPDHPADIGYPAFLRFPLEWPLLIVFLLLATGKTRRAFVACSTILILLVMLLKLADIGVQAAFQRPFNPYLDMKMVRDGWNLISGTIGTVPALVAITGAIGFVVLAVLLLLRSASWMNEASRHQRRLLLSLFACLLMAGAFMLLAGSNSVQFQVSAFVSDRLSLIARSVSEMKSFETELADETALPFAGKPFEAVAGKDVVLVFIESYGRSALEDNRYSGVTLPRLRAVERDMAAVGLKSASGWLTSPTVGGLSWLAHATLLSGLWVDSQAKYDRLMISDRPSLNQQFSSAGWKTVAVMPAITMAWPEAAYFGYDQVLAASDLQYRGRPFNWVTMPDQYTLSAYERLALEPARKQGHNVMAEIALISSHAPWTPVPHMVDWQSIGDGSIFNTQATAGASPSEVWADAGKVREQYIATIDYSLEALGSFMTRHSKNTVFILLGDHQPATIITGPDASRAVPVHILTDDDRLLTTLKAQGFTDGLIPRSSSRERTMSDMRQVLINAFSGR